MAIQKIGRLLVRRGLRDDLPTDLLDGQLAFAIDTGELFVGAPSAPNPTVSNATDDGNIRWATEIDAFAQPNTFASVNLDPGLNPVVIFPTGNNFLIFDYGLSYRDAGPYFAGSLKIYDTSINYTPSSDSSVTFAVQKVAQVRTLTATNNSGSREINLTYQLRSWTDDASSPTSSVHGVALAGSLRKVTAALASDSIAPILLVGQLPRLLASLAAQQRTHGALTATLGKISASATMRQVTTAPVSAGLNTVTSSIGVVSDGDVAQNITSIDGFLQTVTQP